MTCADFKCVLGISIYLVLVGPLRLDISEGLGSPRAMHSAGLLVYFGD